MDKPVDLSELAGGAVGERFSLELRRVLENMMDPNTDAKKKRKLTLEVVFEGNENRDMADVSINTKTTLAPPIGVGTRIVMGRNSKNEIVSTEFYQTNLFKNEDLEPNQTNVASIDAKRAGRE